MKRVYSISINQHKNHTIQLSVFNSIISGFINKPYLQVKKSTLIIIFVSVAFIFSNTKTTFGQFYNNSQFGFFGNTSIGINVGTTLFFGDISQGTNPYQDDWKFGFGFNFRKQISPYFGIGIQFMSGKLHGTKITWANGTDANLFFNSNITSLNLHTIINFSNLLFGYKKERKFSFYGLLGLGVTDYATILRKNTTVNNVTSTAIENTSGFDTNGISTWTPEFTMPMGIGVQLSLSSKWGVNLETNIYRVNSDNLDARISGISKQEYYSYFSAGITYNLSGVGNAFRKARKKDSKYEKESRKLEKYNARIARKNKNREERELLDVERRKNIDKARKERKNRPSSGMPVVVEYDAIYSFDVMRKITEKNMNLFGDDTKNPQIIKDTIVDEGKHFITGISGATITTKTTSFTNQNTSFNPYSSNIISSKSELKSITVPTGGTKLIPNSGLVYTVQILASRVVARNIPQLKQRYNIDQQVYLAQQSNLHRYSAGLFNSFKEAQIYANHLKRMGLSDAFVTIYKNGRRIYKQTR
jgi:opacity protein-like surface antigen